MLRSSPKNCLYSNMCNIDSLKASHINIYKVQKHCNKKGFAHDKLFALLQWNVEKKKKVYSKTEKRLPFTDLMTNFV